MGADSEGLQLVSRIEVGKISRWETSKEMVRLSAASISTAQSIYNANSLLCQINVLLTLKQPLRGPHLLHSGSGCKMIMQEHITDVMLSF